MFGDQLGDAILTPLQLSADAVRSWNVFHPVAIVGVHDPIAKPRQLTENRRLPGAGHTGYEDHRHVRIIMAVNRRTEREQPTCLTCVTDLQAAKQLLRLRTLDNHRGVQPGGQRRGRRADPGVAGASGPAELWAGAGRGDDGHLRCRSKAQGRRVGRAAATAAAAGGRELMDMAMRLLFIPATPTIRGTSPVTDGDTLGTRPAAPGVR